MFSLLFIVMVYNRKNFVTKGICTHNIWVKGDKLDILLLIHKNIIKLFFKYIYIY